MITCVYSAKRLTQPILRHHNKNYHLQCYLDKDGSRIITKPMLDNLSRRLECMKEICDNFLDEKSSLEERKKKFEAIKIKYADLKRT